MFSNTENFQQLLFFNEKGCPKNIQNSVRCGKPPIPSCTLHHQNINIGIFQPGVMGVT